MRAGRCACMHLEQLGLAPAAVGRFQHPFGLTWPVQVQPGLARAAAGQAKRIAQHKHAVWQL